MAVELGEVVEAVHGRVLAAPSIPAALEPAALADLVRDEAPLLAPAAVGAVVARVRDRATGLGPLEPLLADPAVTEVMVNGPGPVWVERHGRLAPGGVEVDGPTVDRLVARVLAPVGARADRASPLADARLPDGSRVHVVVPPLAVDGACITIRRFGARAVPLDAFAGPEVVALLARAVEERRQVVVSGGAGAGKTTLLNALAGLVPPGERIVTVEDAAELRLPGDHVVRLEARPAGVEGTGAVTIRDLVRAALRMRPDRIVVGEVRGPEALDMLQAMTTGHDGSLSTCHANGPADALRRLETMVLMGADLPLRAVREQVASAVDLVVQVARGVDGHRRVVEVAEVSADPDAPVRVAALADGRHTRSAPSRPPRRAVAHTRGGAT
ncbi:CpaF family protein [Iamia majanohamensis]|uniref:CpaF family protein n=1 Tax=Iamia majanohamensis TaxID=467976 RepID=A0AAE9YEQ0_9ACTN|nr:CpaF family protein [Iamia majanohamensis]WCO66506.1 CpaF family protein [Iamia majanohamensis]